MIREPSHYRAHRGRSAPTFLWVFVGGGVAFVSRGSQQFVCEQSYFGRRAPLVWYQFLDPMIVVVLAVELAGLSA